MADHIKMPHTDQADEWNRDLHPGPKAGGTMGATAYDRKDLHRQLATFNDRELKDIPLVPEDSKLEQGAVYTDLAEAAPREFTAQGDEVAGRHHAYVPKDEVDYVLWNRLIGVDNPARLDQAAEAPR